MQVNTIVVGPLQTNCYVLSTDERDAVIIDPGDDADRIIQHIRMHDLSVKGIWLTHGHFDHVQAVGELKRVFGCPVTACLSEKMLLEDANYNLSMPFSGLPVTVQADVWYTDNDTFSFGDETVRVLHTPGHTSGSCCYQVGNWLFSGDTLFYRSIGRTDFPTGDVPAMRASLARLADLDGEYTILSGHGPATTLSAERRENPYLAHI